MKRSLLPLLPGLALVLAACGTQTAVDDAGTGSEPSAVAEAPTEVPSATGKVTGLGLVIDDWGDAGPELCLGPVAESYPPQCGGIPMRGWDWSQVEGFDTVGKVRFGTYAVTGTFDGTTFTVTDEPVLGALYDPMAVEDPAEHFATRCPEPDGGWRVVDPDLASDRALEEVARAAMGLPGYAAWWLDPLTLPDAGATPDAPAAGSDPEGSTAAVVNVLVTEDTEGAEAALREVWGGPLCVSEAERTEAEIRAVAEEVTSLPGISAAAPDLDRVRVDVTFDDGSIQAYLDERFGEGVVTVFSALRPAAEDAPAEE